MPISKPNIALYNQPSTFSDFHGMPYRFFGKSGLRVSTIGLGTWKYGYPETGDGSRVDLKTAMPLLDRAWELGVTLWDTANRYNLGSGNSERVIGHWLENNPDKRRDIIVASKVWGGMDGLTPNHWGLSRANIIDSVHACLERLGTDYMDILYFHRPDPTIPLEESLLAVEDLIKEDTVRYFGISNADLATVKEYDKFIAENSPMRTKLCAVQNRFDILRGENASDAGVLDYAAQTGLSFVAWSPLGQGLLTGRYNDPNKVGAGDRLFDEKNMSTLDNKQLFEKLNRLSELAASIGVELTVLVLAYMTKLPGMGPVIPAASNIKQLEVNASAATLELTDEQIAAINEIIK